MLDWLNHCGISSLTHTEREVELLKPIEDVTIYEKESASFDAEISEEDVPGQWKLKGELLRPSPVSNFLSVVSCTKLLSKFRLNIQIWFNNDRVTSGFLNLKRRKEFDRVFVDPLDI